MIILFKLSYPDTEYFLKRKYTIFQLNYSRNIFIFLLIILVSPQRLDISKLLHKINKLLPFFTDQFCTQIYYSSLGWKYIGSRIEQNSGIVLEAKLTNEGETQFQRCLNSCDLFIIPKCYARHFVWNELTLIFAHLLYQ